MDFYLDVEEMEQDDDNVSEKMFDYDDQKILKFKSKVVNFFSENLILEQKFDDKRNCFTMCFEYSCRVINFCF